MPTEQWPRGSRLLSSFCYLISPLRPQGGDGGAKPYYCLLCTNTSRAGMPSTQVNAMTDFPKHSGKLQDTIQRHPGGCQVLSLVLRFSRRWQCSLPETIPWSSSCLPEACCCCCCVTSVVSDSVQPHRRPPTRLPHPWDSPGKNPGAGYHFLLQCMKVKSEREVTQLSPTLSNPMDCSLPGSSIHGIFQARVLEWGAIAFSSLKPTRGKMRRASLPSVKACSCPNLAKSHFCASSLCL